MVSAGPQVLLLLCCKKQKIINNNNKKDRNSQVRELPLPLRHVDCSMMMLLLWLGSGDRRPPKVGRP